MKLTKTSAHAALAMSYLASHTHKGLVQARHIATFLDIPTDSALKILQTLARQGLLHSQLGRSGGYQLQHDPGEITLLHVVQAIDGPLKHAMPIRQPHQRLEQCVNALKEVYEQAAAHLRDELSRTTIASLAERENSILAAAS